MANPKHLEILKHGVMVWNKWREKAPKTVPDLVGANLIDAKFSDLNLRGANLYKAFFSRADLSEADLSGADMRDTNFLGANLRSAIFVYADLRGAELNYADLSHADLRSANLMRTLLYGSIFNRATVGHTIFADVYLAEAKGLERVIHSGPSEISISTIYLSKGKIPEAFLRGCGVPEDFIVHIPSLVASVEPIQLYSCFISYSSKDQEFTNRLYADLQAKNVRCWFAPEDLKIGDKFRSRIDEVIRVYDKLLLILSENSVSSQWVEKEVETAMEREREQNKIVLFPIRLDDMVNEMKAGWPADVRRSRHIGDFTHWKDHDSYQKAFDRLLRDLKAEGTKGNAAPNNSFNRRAS